MALLTRQDCTIAGVVPTYVAVSASDTFPCDENTFVYVKNGGASPDTVAVNSIRNCDQGFDHDGGGSVTNATEKVFGPFPQGRFADPTSGLATITHSFTTSVTCAVVRLP